MVNPKPEADGSKLEQCRKFFINRPIVAMVIAILMVIVGVVSMLALPIAQFPSIVPPEIHGAGDLSRARTRRRSSNPSPRRSKQQISGVDNMNYMYSINANNGQTQITVNFDVKTDPNIDQVSDPVANVAGAVATCRRR